MKMLVPHGTLVMVVDGAKAQLFRNSGANNALKLSLLDTEAQIVPRTSEMGDERPGRSFQSGTVARSAHQTTDIHQMMEDRFVEEAAKRLSALIKDDGRGILIAAPHTLGVMRKHLGAEARKHLLAEIAKDDVDRPAADIAAMLERYEA
jgi:protein required for attachment to host cells